jgi:hypothetical protein
MSEGVDEESVEVSGVEEDGAVPYSSMVIYELFTVGGNTQHQMSNM